MSKGTARKNTILQGTLDLIVLRTLQTSGSTHGWGLAKCIQQISSGMLNLNQGTLYPALLRLERQGCIQWCWGASDSNRRAKFYNITRDGLVQVEKEVRDWALTVSLVNTFVHLPKRTP
jgi:transcriptional regulator